MTEIKIRGYHCDAYGHVNNARILEFYEDCRWDFLEKGNKSEYFETRGLQFFIVNINVDYKLSLEPGMTIKIGCKVYEHGNTSFTFLQEMYLGERLAGKALIKFVLFDKNTKRPSKVLQEHLSKMTE
jgi:thioesterase-3